MPTNAFKSVIRAVVLLEGSFVNIVFIFIYCVYVYGGNMGSKSINILKGDMKVIDRDHENENDKIGLRFCCRIAFIRVTISEGSPLSIDSAPGI